jgi:hypothetical protein
MQGNHQGAAQCSQPIRRMNHTATSLTAMSLHQYFPHEVFSLAPNLLCCKVMAEAAGLAIGVIALASLFNSCVELLEYFELGKNYLYDYDLACTKVNILHKRLSIWGGATHIQDPDHEHPALQRSVQRDIVSKSLHTLKDILSDTDGLRRKYDLSPVTRPSLGTPRRQQSHRIAHWTRHLRRRTTWSIRDKAKFDRFIEDISFLIENLEKVTNRSSSSDMVLPPTSSQQSQNGPVNPRSTAIMQQVGGDGPFQQQFLLPREETGQIALRPNQPNLPHSSTSQPNYTTNAASGSTPDSSTGRAYSTGGTYTELSELEQINVDSQWSGQGFVDPSKGVNILRKSKQHNQGGAGGFQGSMSAAAALQTQKQANEQYCKEANH